jgi:hypothetical protein
MAELPKLEGKLAEVLGLGGAAKGATETVKSLLDDDEQDLASSLERMPMRPAKPRSAASRSPVNSTARRRRSSTQLGRRGRRRPR